MASNKTIIKTIRMDADLSSRVAAFAAASGLSESEGLRELIRFGLASRGMEMYEEPLARLLREILTGYGDIYLERFEHAAAMQEERICKLAARAAKASIQTCIMQVDAMKAIYPAMAEMPDHEIWKAYDSQAGRTLQVGFKGMKAELGRG